MSSVLFEKIDGVAKITLNREKVYNSFNREMALRLQEILEQCATDDEVRAIYLTGAGKGFCAGQDLGEAIDPESPNIDQIVEEHYNPIIRLLRTIEKPIVGAVNGVAAGAGANIALACDICVAAASANFVQAFSKIGLIPDSGGTFYLPRLVGMQKAAGLMMLADNVSGKEAEAMNMIYRAFDDEVFEEESWKMAVKLASMPTVGIGLTKRLLNQAFENGLNDQLAQEAIVQAKSAESSDHKEGIQAFLDKRKPEFTGK